MDGWQDRLHISFVGEHFLFGALRIDSLSSFLLASLLTICFCLSERMLTLALSKRWNPLKLQSRSRVALWRTGLYWLVTFDRLIYMLVAMTFHLGIIFVTVTALSAGQYIIEYVDTPHLSTKPSTKRSYLLHMSQESDYAKEPLLSSPCSNHEEFSSSMARSVCRVPPQRVSAPTHSPYPWKQRYARQNASSQFTTTTRPRSKSKPDGLFIHPAQSNILRAEALAIQAGLTAGNADLVDATSYMYPLSPELSLDQATKRGERGWGGGKGRDIARGLLLGDTKGALVSDPFRIGDDDV